MLIRFILVFFILLMTLQSSDAAECKKGMGAQYKVKKLPEIQAMVLKAILNQDDKSLIKYASCDFKVGPTESDGGSFTDPKKIVNEFLKITKPLKWKKKGQDYKTQYNLPSESTNPEYEIVFRIDDNKGWYWAGFVTSDSKTNELLQKDSYQLGKPSED